MKQIVISLLLCLVTVQNCAAAVEATCKPGTVILIVGTSSAGKSSIVAQLQRLTDARYEVIKYDDFDWDKIKNHNAVQLWGWDPQKESFNEFVAQYICTKTGAYPGLVTELSIGCANALRKELYEADQSAFYRYIKAVAQNGKNIIVDTVFHYATDYDLFMKFLQDHKVVKILAYCPFDKLEERVEQRNSTGKPEEQRTLFQAQVQFPAFYRPQESAKDVITDTVECQRLDQALLKALRLRKNELNEQLRGAPQNEALLVQSKLQGIDRFYDAFVKRFKLHESHEIQLVPTRPYNLVINTAKQLPAESAQAIDACVHKQ